MPKKSSVHPTASRLAAAMAVAVLLSACVAAPMKEPVVGYACCNLRVSDGWVSSNNVQTQTFIQFGEPIRLTEIKKRYYAYGHVGSAEVAFRDDHAATENDTMRWLRDIVVAQDPTPRLEAWAPEMRQAVRQGRATIGMTREQVRMSLGPPGRTDTSDLNSKSWRYWTVIGDMPVDVVFDDDGRVESLRGNPSAVRLVELQR